MSRVQIVVDDTACIEPAVARKNGIFVVPLGLDPSDKADGEMVTSAVSPLRLCATYARALERGGDAGVVAIHVCKGLSATWSNAVTAAGVLDNVCVIDTSVGGAGVGAVLGAAAIRAAKVAASGGTLDQCQAAAEDMLARSGLWLYVPKLEPLRRGGRISTGQAVLSTALAIKPIVGFQGGTLAMVAKCRTELKVKERLVQFAMDAVAGSVDAAAGAGAAGASNAAGAGAADAGVPRASAPHILLHHADALDDVTELQAMLELVMPRGTRYKIVDLPPSLVAHTGPGAYALGIIVDGIKLDDAPIFASTLPTWSANRRRAIEKAEELTRAISELARRDHSDPEGARFGDGGAQQRHKAGGEE